MDSKTIRYQNTRLLVEQVGGVSNFANKINKGQSQTSQFAGTSPIKGIGNKVAREIEEAFSKPHGWLDMPHSDINTLDNNVNLNERIILEGRPIPVISWVAAGSFETIETVLRDAEVEETLPPNKDCGKNGYGLIITGNSMLPKFEPEDRIYVNPDFQVSDLKTNDLVIVSCTGDSEATFKKIIIEGESRFLEPLNPNWPEKIIKMSNDCRLVGKVVGQYRKW